MAKTKPKPVVRLDSKQAKIKRTISRNQVKTRQQIVAILAKQGIRISPKTVGTRKSKMRKDGILPKIIKADELNSRNAIIRRTIFYNQNKTPEEIVNILRENGVETSTANVGTYKHRMRKEGTLPKINREIRLTKAQEQLMQQSTGIIKKAIFEASKRHNFFGERTRDFSSYVNARLASIFARFDPEKKAQLRGWLITNINFIALNFIREEVKQGTGLTFNEADIIGRIIKRNEPGKSIEEAIEAAVKSQKSKNAKKYSVEEAIKIWEAYQRYLRTTGGSEL
ncbi:MAG: hypothetical protein ABIH20_03270 [Candidatus Diapherotrites archaeon]